MDDEARATIEAPARGAMRAGDTDRAREVLRTHMHETTERIVALLET